MLLYCTQLKWIALKLIKLKAYFCRPSLAKRDNQIETRQRYSGEVFH